MSDTSPSPSNANLAPPVKSTHDWLSISIAAGSLVFSIIALVISLSIEDDRGRKSAALRMCETYSSGLAMRNITADIFSRTTSMKGNIVERWDYSPAQIGNSSANLKNAELRRLLTVWVNFFDVIATGLDANEYDRKIIGDCFGPTFEHLASKIVGPNGKVFEKQDYSRVVDWAKKLGSSRQPD